MKYFGTLFLPGVQFTRCKYYQMKQPQKQKAPPRPLIVCPPWMKKQPQPFRMKKRPPFLRMPQPRPLIVCPLIVCPLQTAQPQPCPPFSVPQPRPWHPWPLLL